MVTVTDGARLALIRPGPTLPLMILLASASPQRSALLAAAGLAFQVVPAPCDEAAIHRDDPVATAIARARAKIEAAVLPVDAPLAGAIVLGADTLVVFDGAIIGKPADRADARRILAVLQGTTHAIITAHAACLSGRPETLVTAVDMVDIAMRPMTTAEIAAYVASGESDGKAGAYALQEGADRFVANLDGARDTVIGLSLRCVADLHWRLLGCSPTARV